MRSSVSSCRPTTGDSDPACSTHQVGQNEVPSILPQHLTIPTKLSLFLLQLINHHAIRLCCDILHAIRLFAIIIHGSFTIAIKTSGFVLTLLVKKAAEP